MNGIETKTAAGYPAAVNETISLPGYQSILNPNSSCRPLLNAEVAACAPNVPPGEP